MQWQSAADPSYDICQRCIVCLSSSEKTYSHCISNIKSTALNSDHHELNIYGVCSKATIDIQKTNILIFLNMVYCIH